MTPHNRFGAALAGLAALSVTGCRQESEPSNPAPAERALADRVEEESYAVAPAATPEEKHPDQPENLDSGGSLKLPFLRASRQACASPCAVMFSIDAITDSSNDNPYALSGSHWDYGDPGADGREGPYTRGARASRSKTGPTRQSDTNTGAGWLSIRTLTKAGAPLSSARFNAGASSSNAPTYSP